MASLQRAYKVYVRDFKLSRPFNPFCQRYPFALSQVDLTLNADDTITVYQLPSKFQNTF